MRKNLIRRTRNEYRRTNAVRTHDEIYRDKYVIYDCLNDRASLSRISMRKLILSRLSDNCQYWSVQSEYNQNEFIEKMRCLIQGIKDFNPSPNFLSQTTRLDRILVNYLLIFHMYRFLKAHNVDVPKLPKQLKKDFADKIQIIKENDAMPTYPEDYGIFISEYVVPMPVNKE